MQTALRHAIRYTPRRTNLYQNRVNTETEQQNRGICVPIWWWRWWWWAFGDSSGNEIDVGVPLSLYPSDCMYGWCVCVCLCICVCSLQCVSGSPIPLTVWSLCINVSCGCESRRTVHSGDSNSNGTYRKIKRHNINICTYIFSGPTIYISIFSQYIACFISLQLSSLSIVSDSFWRPLFPKLYIYHAISMFGQALCTETNMHR